MNLLKRLPQFEGRWRGLAGERVARDSARRSELLFAVDHILVNGTLEPIDVHADRTALARIASDHFPLVELRKVSP